MFCVSGSGFFERIMNVPNHKKANTCHSRLGETNIFDIPISNVAKEAIIGVIT